MIIIEEVFSFLVGKASRVYRCVGKKIELRQVLLFIQFSCFHYIHNAKCPFSLMNFDAESYFLEKTSFTAFVTTKSAALGVFVVADW